MRTLTKALKPLAAFALAFGLGTGCESTDGGSAQVNGSVYYGVGFYDTWYDGDFYYPPDAIAPPVRDTAGMSNLAAAMSIPGVTLSQLLKRTKPSRRCACAITSTESATSSRLGKE